MKNSTSPHHTSYQNKIKMINRCDLMLQDLKHFKTVIMLSSFKSVQSVQGVQGVQGVPCVHPAIISSCPLDH